MSEPRLYLHAKPHADESCASWMVRTAEMHGLTVAELLRSFNVVKRRDLDIAMSPRVLAKFTRGMEYPIEPVRMMAKFFSAFRVEKWTSTWLKASPAGVPLFGYCPHCLEEDPCPYWRSTWRLKYWVLCPKHGCLILNVCMACEMPLTVFDYHKRRPVRNGMSLCGCCFNCGAELRHAVAGSFRWALPRVREFIDLQNVVTAALVRGSFRLAGFEEAIPLALLPSILMAGAVRASSSPVPIDQMAGIEVREAIRALKRGGEPGFFVDRRKEFVSAKKAMWKGAADQLAQMLLWTRFSTLPPYAPADRQGDWLDILLRQMI